MKKKLRKKITKLENLEQINLNAAGIDIGSREIWVCVPEDRDTSSVRTFATFTENLLEIASWLKQCRIKTVAMESTGVYWIPLFDILEQKGFDVYLVNARTVKNVPGRKSDILDCQWLQQLHTYGLLRGSFRPPEAIRILRDFNRHRDDLIAHRAAHIQHMQKALHLMNLQLDNVISDITGKTGMAIIRDIIAGQRNPKALARHRDSKCRNSEETIEKSLYGHYAHEHVFKLKHAVELYDYYTQKINECDHEMRRQYQRLSSKANPEDIPPPSSRRKNTRQKNTLNFDVRGELYRVCGVDLLEVPGLNVTTINTVISETGTDMSKWPTDKHFSSWLCVCPTNEISGGKVLKTRTRRTASRANNALRQASQSLYRSDSYLGAYHRRMRARLGPAKAITATANKLAKIIYTMLKEQTPYVELGATYYEQKFKQRQLKYLVKRASALGFYLTPQPNV